ncbi:MAG: archease [Candidatus Aminicenantia bacterium]
MFLIFFTTADAGVKVESDSLEELFIDSAKGMFYLMTEKNDIKKAIEKIVEVESHEIDFLLFQWLSELLYLSEVEKVIFGEFEIINLRDNYLKAICRGERLSPGLIKRIVKAVTLHNLRILWDNDKWKTEIIFDL